MNGIFARITHARHKGESFGNVLSYWLPELISNTILITLPPIVDAWIITRLGSTTMYGAMGMGINFLHTLIKVSEAIPVAAIAVIGRHNGAQEYEKCGEDLGNTFWTTFLIGFSQFALIFLGASYIYHWLGVPEAMVRAGTPFLQLKSFGVLLIFITLGLMSFMRAVKNTRIPMMINLIGITTFIFFDYALVLGKFGFSQRNLMGSAWATIIQYSIMLAVALFYILTNQDYKKYFSKLFITSFNSSRIGHLLNLSWPIIVDKTAIAMSYVWLSKMLATMGKHAIVSYDVVKNLERFAFLPVMASAGVITFLVSNYLGANDEEGTRANVKKMYFLTCVTVIPALLILSFNAHAFVSIFDPQNKFTYFAAAVLPIISLLVIFDFTQVFLAAAMRGAGDVKAVMIGRVLACGGFFVPVSYMFSKFTFLNEVPRFILIYGSFYVTTGIMGMFYMHRIISRKWCKHKL